MTGFGGPHSGYTRGGFTLVEVMVAVAIAGLVIAGGFTLVTISLRALAEVKSEQELINEAQKVYLDYLTKEDMANRGEKDGVKWRTETDSALTFGDIELKYRRLVVEYKDREMTLYLPE